MRPSYSGRRLGAVGLITLCHSGGRETESMEKVTSCVGRAQLTILALRDQEEGQALVEYALLLSLIAIVSVVILRALGLQVANIFSNVNTQI
jgi:Flp pilus assembly pilin Flp